VADRLTDLAALLAALQIGDSAFPTGGYTQSHGLEAAVAIGRVRDLPTAEAYLHSLLAGVVGPTDVVALVHAATATDLGTVVAIDRALFARKLAREPRQASQRAGRALLAVLPALGVPSPLLRAYAEAVRSGRTPGVQPVAFGLVAGWLGLDPAVAAAVYLHSLLLSCVGALGRLLPVDHLALQGLVRRAPPLVQTVVARALATPWRRMATSAPEVEILAMVHERTLMHAFAT